jgi:hypothetical protein
MALRFVDPKAYVMALARLAHSAPVSYPDPTRRQFYDRGYSVFSRLLQSAVEPELCPV